MINNIFTDFVQNSFVDQWSKLLVALSHMKFALEVLQLGCAIWLLLDHHKPQSQEMVLVEVGIYNKRKRWQNNSQDEPLNPSTTAVLYYFVYLLLLDFGLDQLTCLLFTTVLWCIKKLQSNIDSSTPSAVTSHSRDSVARSKETDVTTKTSSKLCETDQESKLSNLDSVSKVKGQKKDTRRERKKSVQIVTVVNCYFVPDPVHFFQACLYGHKEILRQLLSSHGHEVDIQLVEPVTGYTTFHLACDRGHLSVVHQLMTFLGNECCRQLLTSEGKSGLILITNAPSAFIT
jgi:hypothetical protein